MTFTKSPMATKPEDSQPSTQDGASPPVKRSKKKKIPTNELNLNMYVLTNGGLESTSMASVWYFVNGIGDTWLSPKIFERMLLEDPNLAELAKKAESDEDKKIVEAKVLDIFKKQYMMLLWKKFNSIKGLVTDYVIEKSSTKEWQDDIDNYKDVAKEPDEIKFIEYN